jgi:hypothetical protein
MVTADGIKRLKVIKWRCENDLLFFTRYFFKELEGRKFQVNQHHIEIVDAIGRSKVVSILISSSTLRLDTAKPRLS